MKTKIVKILDVATTMWFLLGKPEESDSDWMRDIGWGGQPINLLVHLVSGGGIEGCMSTFRGSIEYDLQTYGPLSLSGTTVKLAKAVRDLKFEELPAILDVRKNEISKPKFDCWKGKRG